MIDYIRHCDPGPDPGEAIQKGCSAALDCFVASAPRNDSFNDQVKGGETGILTEGSAG
ncbi:hypothetical protein MNBD_ALPHA04-1402 [hydrothermal vent metagenome]|uniref:Uncharacterized protein n=1 Tax=hydrothermal vent metagenome TaxID=652676 RepID=A0A3B0SPN7_9ZZZZ